MSMSLTMASSSSLGNGSKVSLVEPGDDTILIVRKVLEMGRSDEPVDRLGLRVPDMLDESVGLMAELTLTVMGIEGGWEVWGEGFIDTIELLEELKLLLVVLCLWGLRQPLHLHSKHPLPST